MSGLCYECFLKSLASKCSVKDATILKPKERMMQDGNQRTAYLLQQEELIHQSLGQGKGTVGVKDDNGKLMYHLLPWRAIRGLVEVLSFGAKKYSPNGWKTVPNAQE